MDNFIKNGTEYGRQYGKNGKGSGRIQALGSMLTYEQIRAVVEYVRSL